jgi:hypothetical protein
MEKNPPPPSPLASWPYPFTDFASSASTVTSPLNLQVPKLDLPNERKK